MANQPRLEPLEASALFVDGMASRPLVPGTVPQRRGAAPLVAHSVAFETGMVDGELIQQLPPELSDPQELRAILERGHERYGIFCSHCHDLLGTGHGMVPQRGFPQPPTYHSERLRNVPLGYIYDVATNGRGAMPAHRGQISARDRWAIAAYVRALQFSQHARVAKLPPADRKNLEATAP
jgi:mono/diheme cytochrome c family protein